MLFFAEEGDPKHKRYHKVDVDRQGGEASDRESGGEVSEEDKTGEAAARSSKRGVSLKSGIFAKASDIRIVKQVLHANAMMDAKETDGHDLTLAELPFHLLVAGEI